MASPLCGGTIFRKTRGMGAARKLKNHRRTQRWADKAYKKSHLGNEWKKPFQGSSHAKGIVLEKMSARPPFLARLPSACLPCSPSSYCSLSMGNGTL